MQAELQQHRTSTSDRSLRIVQLDTELAAKEAAVKVCVTVQASEVLCFEHSPWPVHLQCSPSPLVLRGGTLQT